MTFLVTLVRTESAKAVGWTLLHSLWEGAAVALALAAVLGMTRSSRARYAAACAAMFLLLGAFGMTLYRLLQPEVGHAAVVQALPRPSSPLMDVNAGAVNRSAWDPAELLPWLSPVWFAGVLLFQLRCLASWAAAGRLRRVGVCRPLEAWIETLRELQTRLAIARPVILLESCIADVPVVIGHLRPLILMPVGLLAGLPAAQVEAILLHELAHIRRGDYLVNLMQSLVEGLLFYHPAVWWISSVICTERENCCDDLVVSTNNDPHEYARALTALAENRWAGREIALAASGGNLVKRIRRLLAAPEGPRTTFAPLLSVGLLAITGAVGLAAWQKPVQQAPLFVALQAPPPVRVSSKYDKWIREEVAYIITDQERAAFRKLGTDTERDRFIEEFWKRRDPTPDTPANEFKDEHYRRIDYANSRFADPKLQGWKTDRGRIYIEYGPPDEIDSHPSGGAYTRPPEEGGARTVTYPFEQWRYRFIEGIGDNVIIEFVDKDRTGEYRMTMDPAEKVVAAAKPPALRFSQPFVSSKLNVLPMRVRVDYVPVTSSYVLAQIRVQFDTKDLHFHDQDNISTATVNIYGRVSTIGRRPLSPFEDVVQVSQPTATLRALIEENEPQVYRRTLALEPGRYRLNIAAKDIVGGNAGSYEIVLDVPGTAQ